MALLFLRTVAGGYAAIGGGVYLAQIADPAAASWLAGVFAIVGGIALIAGVVTPAAAVAVTVATFLIAVSGTAAAAGMAALDRAATVLLIADAAALALLGPGAFSIDAYLFGRREIIIAHARPQR